MWDAYLFPAYMVLGMFGSALVSKALGASVLFGLGLVMVYPDADKASILFLFYIPAVLLAAFRD